MAGLLYYLPRVQLSAVASAGRLNRALFDGRGIAPAFADCRSVDDVARAEVAGKGPDGGPGLILSPLPVESREPPRRLGYFPRDEHQEWTQISETLWVGVDRAMSPTPADLARAYRHPGTPVALGDGNEWIVPTIREPTQGQPLLPRDMYYDAAGEFRMELRPEYREVWVATERAAAVFFGEGEQRLMPFVESLGIALAGLALNYRIGQPEQRVLRLVTTQNWDEVLGAMLGIPWLREVERRLGEAERDAQRPFAGPPAANPLSPGSAAGDPDIAQPEPNSTLA